MNNFLTSQFILGKRNNLFVISKSYIIILSINFLLYYNFLPSTQQDPWLRKEDGREG